MKKLALLLAALGVVSAATYAAPELTVTSIGQEVEIEHTNGSDDTTAWLYNNVGLAYGDWTFGLKGAKQWNYDDTDNYNAKGEWEGKGVSSKDSRLDLEAWRKINDDLRLGVKYRGQDDFARYMVMYNYNHGMFLSNGDFWYQVNENGNDTLRAEWFPVGVNLGPVTFKYLMDYSKTVGTVQENKEKSSIEHQLRAYAPLYKGERFAVNTEIRHTLHQERDMDHDAGYDNVFEDFGRTRIYLKTSYAMTENLNVYANYAYQFGEFDGRNGKPAPKTKNYYQNFTFGWTYKF